MISKAIPLFPRLHHHGEQCRHIASTRLTLGMQQLLHAIRTIAEDLLLCNNCCISQLRQLREVLTVEEA